MINVTDGVTVYSDGACSGNPGPGGWGAVILCGGAERTLSGGEVLRVKNRARARILPLLALV